MPISRTGEEAFECAVTAASRSSSEVSGPEEFAGVVYSFYERALADDDVSNPWSEQKVKEHAQKEWIFTS